MLPRALLLCVILVTWASPLGAAPLDDLTTAAAEGDLAAIERLIAEGVDVNSPDSEGWYPLGRAAYADQVRAINLLVKKQAKVDQTTLNGYTPLMFAAARGNAKAALALVANGADVNKINPRGRTAKDEALARRHYDLAGILAALEVEPQK